jgi:ribosomal protein S17E
MKANALAKENKKPLEQWVKPKVEIQKKLMSKTKSVSSKTISNMIGGRSLAESKKLIDV